jgi:AP-3 complex subunit sigma
MIYSVMVINHHGQPRLTKFYDKDLAPFNVQEGIVNSVFQCVSKRSDSVCNFVEGQLGDVYGEDVRLVYRHYATLYFVFAVDKSESELGVLDLIQVFVEGLDKCFEDVCELDLIFNPDKAHNVLQEICMGGMVLETSLAQIVRAVTGTSAYEDATRDSQVKVTKLGKGRQ